MKTFKNTAIKLTVLAAVISLSSISASAALYSRGNGMIYDSTQNITWLQDANYAKTSGLDADGWITWQQATDWAANLVYGGYTDWRLSSARLNDKRSWSYDGSTDRGHNNTRSELGHLFFELGNIPYCNTSGCGQPGAGQINTMFVDAGTNRNVSFLNMQLWGYWQVETDTIDPASAWYFYPYDGYQDLHPKYFSFSAWAVRDGDVFAVNEVPVPAAAWFMGSSLICLAGIARRRK